MTCGWSDRRWPPLCPLPSPVCVKDPRNATTRLLRVWGPPNPGTLLQVLIVRTGGRARHVAVPWEATVERTNGRPSLRVCGWTKGPTLYATFTNNWAGPRARFPACVGEMLRDFFLALQSGAPIPTRAIRPVRLKGQEKAVPSFQVVHKSACHVIIFYLPPSSPRVRRKRLTVDMIHCSWAPRPLKATRRRSHFRSPCL